jgi:ketosteroid isomerase-like protein
MKKMILLLTVTFAGILSIVAQPKDEKEIRNVLALQDEAWNKGDIEAFMQGYWKNDSLMFIGKSGITYGWQKTMDNYKKGYPDTAAMGKLRFELVQFKKLSAENYFVVGKWFLTRSIGNVMGSFTLLLRKIKSKWVIIADHSS